MPNRSKKQAASNQFISNAIRQNLCIWEISADMLALDRIFAKDDGGFQKKIKDLDRRLTGKGLWAKLLELI